MGQARNPVEKAIDTLCRQWLQATSEPQVRVIVWRVPGNALALFAAFVEAQQHAQTAATPDLFIHFDAAFDTGYRYSRALKDALLDGYLRSRDTLGELDLPVNWNGPFEQHPDTPAGFLALLDSFTRHHGERLRLSAAVLWPDQVAAPAALTQWLDQAVSAPVPGRVRLVLVETHAQPLWQALLDRHPAQVRQVDAPLDMFDLAHATAAQSAAGGPPGSAAYRQMLTDVMSLLDRRSAADTAHRADRALALAQRQQWPDQQVVVHMAVAGAWLKEQQYRPALLRYRSARECALQAREQQHPAAGDLLMQTWFGEAGTLLAAAQPDAAAQAYAQAAQTAAEIPNALFVVEGYRMAGHCLARARQREGALQHYLQGLAAAREMSQADRVQSTFPLLLQDLLQLEDSRRATALSRCADSYREAIVQAHAHAEQQSARQPATRPEALEAIDADLVARCEAAFSRLVKEREQLIGGGDVFFRKTVAVARELLHAGWNGLPDVRHPLDKDMPEWKEPPGFLALPDGDDLASTPLATPGSTELADTLQENHA